MDESAIVGKTVQIPLGFASSNFPVVVPFFPKSLSHSCNDLYYLALFEGTVQQKGHICGIKKIIPNYFVFLFCLQKFII